jgi:hypothetical protein
MLDRLIDRLGDSNPQIFRELKERLTPRNIGIAIVASLLIQGFTLLYFNNQIPVSVPEPAASMSSAPTNSGDIQRDSYKPNDNIYNKYCRFSPDEYGTALCKLDSSGNFKINWQLWRSDLFSCLNWIFSLGLILGSIYMLVADLVREEKRGTLNFIRLSPQSARTIFSGKIASVPILVYLAAAVMLPLHLWFGFSAGATLPLLTSWYLEIGSMCWLLSSASVLYVLLGGFQAIVTVAVVALPICLPLLAINAYLTGTINQEKWLDSSNNHLSWFGLTINSSAIWFYAFGIGCCIVASYGVWQALERRYLNPTATVISKSQSYLTNLCLQLWIGGFTIPLIFADPDKYYATRQILTWLAIVDFVALLLLIPMLLPSKQAIQDWSRYRRERTYQPRKFWKRDLVQDLITNDKSPALLTIAINVCMAMVFWIPVSILALTKPTHGMSFNEMSSPGYAIKILAEICLAASLILIYAAIAHVGLFLKVRKRNLWIASIVGGAMFLPLVCAYVLSPMHTPTGFAAIVLLFSPFAASGIMSLSGGTILAAFAVQLGMFAALTRHLQHKLQTSGQSQTRELLGHS